MPGKTVHRPFPKALATAEQAVAEIDRATEILSAPEREAVWRFAAQLVAEHLATPNGQVTP